MKFIAFKTSQVSLHMGVAFLVTYTFTGSLAVGGVAAIVEPLCNVSLMPLHDKLWARIGKKSAGVNLSKTAGTRAEAITDSTDFRAMA